MTRPLSDLSPLASGLDHPEGIAWAPDGHLYATGEAGQVYQIDIESGTARVLASTGGFGLGLAADAAGRLYVCDMGRKTIVRVDPDGTVTNWSSGPADAPFRVPNYPAFAPDGTLYVSDSGGWGAMDGRVIRLEPGGAATVWSDAAAGFTNGLALSPDARHLYVVESNPPAISRLEIRADGSAGPREAVASLPGTVPDGIAFDSEGGLVIACYAPDRILRLARDGTLVTLYDDPTRMALNAPTNIAFAGRDRDVLAIASLGGYTVQGARMGLRGVAMPWPSL